MRLRHESLIALESVCLFSRLISFVVQGVGSLTVTILLVTGACLSSTLIDELNVSTKLFKYNGVASSDAVNASV